MKFLIFILFFALAGCQNDQRIEQLKSENERLKQQIADNYYQEQAQIERYERVASEYEACRGFVDVCPSSVRDLGEAAIKAGYSGGSDRFWWLLMLKMLALGVLIAR